MDRSTFREKGMQVARREEYKDASVEDNWGGSKGSEGTFGLYVLLGILALAGIAADRYFLWELWKH